jgi:1-acyl-sn-glycerol-3-phosphate acyltransferase
MANTFRHCVHVSSLWCDAEAHGIRFPAPKDTRRAVVVSNHVSMGDPFWLDGVFGSEMTFIAASFLFDLPVFGRWLAQARAVCAAARLAQF